MTPGGRKSIGLGAITAWGLIRTIFSRDEFAEQSNGVADD